MAISKVILDGNTLMDVTDSTSTPGTMLDGTVGYQANGVRAVGTTTVPTKTSDLQNDSNFVSDASYVHTDNNFTTTLKNKLDGIAAGAEVNQNAFSTVKVGTTDLAADSKTDTLTITAGSNITLTPTASSDSFTIAATDTTYSNATTSAAGLMSSSDKTKLNGIATGAEVNVQANWTEADSASDAYIKNKPSLATVATSGSYTDLSNKPSIPTATSDLTNDSGFISTNSNTDWAYLQGSSSSTDKYVRWRYVSGIVFVEWYFTTGSGHAGSTITLGTIPSGYRPSKHVSGACYGTGNNVLWWEILTSGEIHAGSKGSSSSAALYGTASYPL